MYAMNSSFNSLIFFWKNKILRAEGMKILNTMKGRVFGSQVTAVLVANSNNNVIIFHWIWRQNYRHFIVWLQSTYYTKKVHKDKKIDFFYSKTFSLKR